MHGQGMARRVDWRAETAGSAQQAGQLPCSCQRRVCPPHKQTSTLDRLAMRAPARPTCPAPASHAGCAGSARGSARSAPAAARSRPARSSAQTSQTAPAPTAAPPAGAHDSRPAARRLLVREGGSPVATAQRQLLRAMGTPRQLRSLRATDAAPCRRPLPVLPLPAPHPAARTWPLSALTSPLAAANCLFSCWFCDRRSSASACTRPASCRVARGAGCAQGGAHAACQAAGLKAAGAPSPPPRAH